MGKITTDSRIMVIHMDTENSKDGATKQQGSILKNGNRKNANTHNQKKEIPWTLNEEGGFEKLYPHGAHRGLKKIREDSGPLT